VRHSSSRDSKSLHFPNSHLLSANVTLAKTKWYKSNSETDLRKFLLISNSLNKVTNEHIFRNMSRRNLISAIHIDTLFISIIIAHLPLQIIQVSNNEQQKNPVELNLDFAINLSLIPHVSLLPSDGTFVS
jgi:hypothetical protein